MFNTIKQNLITAFNRASEFYKDMKAAFSKGALPHGELLLREAEFVAGVGEVALAPEAPGGAFMIGDAARTLAKAGHKARLYEQRRHLNVL